MLKVASVHSITRLMPIHGTTRSPIEPSSELRSLEQRILARDPDLAGPPVAPRERNRGGDPQVLRGYELRDVIGTGAYGVVHRAFQPSVGREVAVKAIRPECANDPAFVRRFEREARVVAQLEHPHKRSERCSSTRSSTSPGWRRAR